MQVRMTVSCSRRWPEKRLFPHRRRCRIPKLEVERKREQDNPPIEQRVTKATFSSAGPGARLSDTDVNQLKKTASKAKRPSCCGSGRQQRLRMGSGVAR